MLQSALPCAIVFYMEIEASYRAANGGLLFFRFITLTYYRSQLFLGGPLLGLAGVPFFLQLPRPLYLIVRFLSSYCHSLFFKEAISQVFGHCSGSTVFE